MTSITIRDVPDEVRDELAARSISEDTASLAHGDLLDLRVRHHRTRIQ